MDEELSSVDPHDDMNPSIDGNPGRPLAEAAAAFRDSSRSSLAALGDSGDDSSVEEDVDDLEHEVKEEGFVEDWDDEGVRRVEETRDYLVYDYNNDDASAESESRIFADIALASNPGGPMPQFYRDRDDCEIGPPPARTGTPAYLIPPPEWEDDDGQRSCR